MVHLKRKGWLWRLFTNLNILFFVNKKHRENGKSTGKRQGKDREFGINRSVATLN